MKMLDDFVNFYEQNQYSDIRVASHDFKRNGFLTEGKTLILTDDTVGIATKIDCRCDNQHLWSTNRVTVNWQEKQARKNSNVSFAINNQFCMAMQLIGGARIEADIVLLYLNLP